MRGSIRDYVMEQPIFCHHNHHRNFSDFEKERGSFDHTSLLGYAAADIAAAGGARPESVREGGLSALWRFVRTTGYGRAVSLGCRSLFDLEYAPENYDQITAALRHALTNKPPSEVYSSFMTEKANTKWVINDSFFYANDCAGHEPALYPEGYRFVWRMDDLFAAVSEEPIIKLEGYTDIAIFDLRRLAEALQASVERLRGATNLAAVKLGIAYLRDLVISSPTEHEAEIAFSRMRSRKLTHGGVTQYAGAVSAAEARPLGDYLLHRLLQLAHDADLPVQIHTGYLAGNWCALNGANASHLLPVFDRYRRVRFDIFHGSLPWMTELGAIAKNYPNVYPDLCWAWAMNPAQTERALSEWLDAVPFNKIFAYGADTGWPWCDVGYALQARQGIARALDQKIDAGYFSPETAREVAAAIMLRNGEEFYGLKG